MSLLPAKFQNTDDMPMSLGKAIAKAIAPRKIDQFKAFETDVHWPKGWTVSVDMGAAKASTAAEKVGTARPLPEAAPPSAQNFKVGDRVRLTFDKGVVKTGTVTEKSFAFHGEWCCVTDDGELGVFRPDQMAHLAPEPAATPVALGDVLIEGAIYRVLFPSGSVWLSRWQEGEWHGSAAVGAEGIAILKNPRRGCRNDVGSYKCLGLEWKP